MKFKAEDLEMVAKLVADLQQEYEGYREVYNDGYSTPGFRYAVGTRSIIGNYHREDWLERELYIPADFGVAMLRAAAKAGLIVQDPLDNTRFYTVKLWEKMEAERSLTPEQRAERTMAWIEQAYADNRLRSPDSPSSWPADPTLNACPSDGLQYVEDMGLATFVKVHGHRRLVPTKYLDAWTTAVEDQERIQARRRERFASVQSRLRELSGVEFDGGPRVELSLLQAEALIEMLKGADSKCHP